MILPMILYNLEEDKQNILFDILHQLSIQMDTPFRIEVNTNSVDDAIQAIEEETGIATVILGVDDLEVDKYMLAFRLGNLAKICNRDHYVVYIIKQRNQLHEILPYCSRSAGIVVCPPEKMAIEQVFRPLLEDYHQMYADMPPENRKWLTLKSTGKIYRVRLQDVISIQAAEKIVEFHTRTQDISVYSSMDQVASMVDESFFRCHRSYFINREYIQYVDFQEMLIRLIDGTNVPLARSMKNGMHQVLAAQTS